jgi:membrane associated rhomboid family serine protease
MTPPVNHLPSGALVCYRHTDRETGVRCTRCDRPICPECMTAASVGFQCPECIREGRKTVRQARTIAGAPVTADSPVTRLILAINVVVFLLVAARFGGTDVSIQEPTIVARLALRPDFIAVHHQYYRLLTVVFLHEAIWHIGFNMYALLLLGDQVERVLGRWRYVALYVAAGVGGSTASFFFSKPNIVGVGASGAIFGLFGALFVIQRRLGGDTSQIIVVLAINLLLGFIPGIDWHAHVGGLVTGAVITAGYVYLGRGTRQRATLHAAVVVVVLAITVVLIGVRTQQVRDLAGVPRSLGTTTARLSR